MVTAVYVHLTCLFISLNFQKQPLKQKMKTIYYGLNIIKKSEEALHIFNFNAMKELKENMYIICYTGKIIVGEWCPFFLF